MIGISPWQHAVVSNFCSLSCSRHFLLSFRIWKTQLIREFNKPISFCDHKNSPLEKRKMMILHGYYHGLGDRHFWSPVKHVPNSHCSPCTLASSFYKLGIGKSHLDQLLADPEIYLHVCCGEEHTYIVQYATLRLCKPIWLVMFGPWNFVPVFSGIDHPVETTIKAFSSGKIRCLISLRNRKFKYPTGV